MEDERQFEAERLYYRFRRRRLRQLIGLAVVVVLVVTLGVLSYFGKIRPLALAPTPKGVPPDALFVNSGLRRSILTRTKVIQYQSGEASNNTNVVTAVLESDLSDQTSGNQFPASLVQVNASPIGQGRLQISTVINPGQLHSAVGGMYQGTVAILAGSQILRIPVVLYLAPRDGIPATVAFLLLVTGATIGLGVKWITESLTRLAAARWRVEDLRRSIGGDRNSLPVMAAALLEEIDDRIRRQDTDEHLDKAFAPLLLNIQHLRSFAAAIRTAEDEIDRQKELIYDLGNQEDATLPLDRDFVESITRAESTRIERLRALDWPWSLPSKTINDVQTLADQCSAATLALGDASAGRINSNTFEVLDRFRKGDFIGAVRLYDEPSQVTSVQPAAPKKPKTPKFRFTSSSYRPSFMFLKSDEGGIVPWMAQRPRWFAGAASVLVVSLVGIQVQYLSSENFGGELADWLALLLWAAVIELSGVSVLDVLGRLGTDNAPRRGSTPTLTTDEPHRMTSKEPDVLQPVPKT